MENPGPQKQIRIDQRVNRYHPENLYLQKLTTLLSQDLDFHSKSSNYASHNFHSFPAKFPPQLPNRFIEALTNQGDIVLDPMAGSGTTVIEALLARRYGLGLDIDPLAIRLTKAKITPLDIKQVAEIGNKIVEQAKSTLKSKNNKRELEKKADTFSDKKTREFINYWFTRETQIELLALISEIEKIDDKNIKSFFELAFSAIIITKTGGVSLALDLAHTRPHRAKIVIDKSGEIISKKDTTNISERRVKLLTKKMRSPIKEFEKRIQRNLDGLLAANLDTHEPTAPNPISKAGVLFGNAQDIPLPDNSIGLIVTSPPYASNAIDYMRAHKFSLVWFGYPIDELGEKRREYIGGEAISNFEFENLPQTTWNTVSIIANEDQKKGLVLHRYYSEMSRVLGEMYRVLQPGRAAIVVVGNSVMRGIDTKTDICLAEIGASVGFQVPKIGVRQLDRNRRMLPTGTRPNLDSQIQQRMHEEYIIGFYKP